MKPKVPAPHSALPTEDADLSSQPSSIQRAPSPKSSSSTQQPQTSRVATTSNPKSHPRPQQTTSSTSQNQQPPERAQRRTSSGLAAFLRVATLSTIPPPPPAEDSTPQVRVEEPRDWWKTAQWFGSSVLAGMERVGESVVAVLGLDDSRYQDVLEGMTEEEMERAMQVQRQREAEFERVRSVREMREQSVNEDGLVMMEAGTATSESSPPAAAGAAMAASEDVTLQLLPEPQSTS